MTSRNKARLVIGVGITSAAVMVWAAAAAAKTVSLGAALVFAVPVIFFAASQNFANLRRRPPIDAATLADASIANATLMALTFGWGALAMLGVYTLSGLWWWHSWQYGLLMLALAVTLWLYASALAKPTHPLRARRLLDVGAFLAVVQGIAAAAALAFLISAGKLASIGVDWPANHVFLAGGIAISTLSLLAGATHFIMRLQSKAS